MSSNVKIYLNRANDGRRYTEGYHDGDPLDLVIEYEEFTGGAPGTIAENAFMIFNVGHENLFDGPVNSRNFTPVVERLAVAYRLGLNRSLSIGDVVEVDGDSYACASDGWTRIFPD